jgi:dTDP-4-dehydrorhamnose reductase
MNILLLGKDGQVGWELERALAPLGEVAALGKAEADLAREDDLRGAIRAGKPQVIVNAAAYTRVDAAEWEPEVARLVNAAAPRLIAEEARRLGAALIHYSTDYVFDGKLRRPYREDDPPNPLSVYAKTKLQGEQAIQEAGGSYLILRTSWVYSLRRPCFLRSVLEWSRSRTSLRIAADQVGVPTWCRWVAESTAMILALARGDPAELLGERGGIYHLASAGSATRFDWAQEILRLDPRAHEQRVGAEEIAPARSDEFPVPAPRPPYSALDSSKAAREFGITCPPWQQALRLAMESGA